MERWDMVKFMLLCKGKPGRAMTGITQTPGRCVLAAEDRGVAGWESHGARKK